LHQFLSSLHSFAIRVFDTHVWYASLQDRGPLCDRAVPTRAVLANNATKLAPSTIAMRIAHPSRFTANQRIIPHCASIADYARARRSTPTVVFTTLHT